MSFLSRYWNMVERQVIETGMNPGDVKIDITQVYKNTEEVNHVDCTEVPMPIETPAAAGFMPDYLAMDSMTRGVARHTCQIENYIAQATLGEEKSTVGVSVAATIPRRQAIRGKKAKASKKLRKQLRKLEDTSTSNVVLAEVRLNGNAIWKPSGTNG